MEILVIGKPAMNVYLPLQEYPQEGDIFTVQAKNESLGNVAATSACLLAQWKQNVHMSGVVGNDGFGEKIRETFTTNKVNTKYLEINYEHKTSTNYNILNSKTGLVTKIKFNEDQVCGTRFKYDFMPDWALFDATDSSGANACLNNALTPNTILYAGIFNHETASFFKRSKYVVTTQSFCENLLKATVTDNVEAYVEFFQKIVDTVGMSRFVIIMKNRKILYCVDGKVKMLPEMTINLADSSSFDSIFTAIFTFGMANGVTLDDTIKLANTGAAISLARIGEVPAIPTIDEVLDNCGLREKLGMGNAYAQPQAAAQDPNSAGLPPVDLPQQQPAVQPQVAQQPVAQQQMPNQQNPNV